MEPIVHSFSYSLDYLRDLIADVPEGSMTEQPNGITNHPAWTIGHLVFIAQAIGAVAGLEPWLSKDWERQFGPGSSPRSEPPPSAGGQFVNDSEGPISKSKLLAACRGSNQAYRRRFKTYRRRVRRIFPRSDIRPSMPNRPSRVPPGPCRPTGVSSRARTH